MRTAPPVPDLPEPPLASLSLATRPLSPHPKDRTRAEGGAATERRLPRRTGLVVEVRDFGVPGFQNRCVLAEKVDAAVVELGSGEAAALLLVPDVDVVTVSCVGEVAGAVERPGAAHLRRPQGPAHVP